MGCGWLVLREAGYESCPDNRDEERMMHWERRRSEKSNFLPVLPVERQQDDSFDTELI